MPSTSESQAAKAAAGQAAAHLIRAGMRVGLGTGSTVAYFLQALGKRCQEGLSIQALASSVATATYAQALGIPLAAEHTLTALDITVDGADEVDDYKRLIKGGGGALLREKIIAYMAQEMIVIVDPSKVVKALGRTPLPIEVLPFAYTATQRHIETQGFEVQLRRDAADKIFVTDNGNYILDVKHTLPYRDLESIDTRLRSIPGVVATGFFLQLAGRILIGHADGHVEVRL